MSEYNLVTANQVAHKESSDMHLRSVDLNLLTVFDAVMQTQNVTRAAHSLGMSQPAVSNAVARLKNMFKDELFVRYGRGIQPTSRARQLFGPVRQALQLVNNELPGAGFEPKNSTRLFNLFISSPLDIRLAASIINNVQQAAPHLWVNITSCMKENIEDLLRYQVTEFFIGYTEFERPDFHRIPLFNDELVLAISKNHRRINDSISLEQLFVEPHAVVSLNEKGSFSEPYYQTNEAKDAIFYEGPDMNSVLSIVSQTYFVAIAPRWLVLSHSETLNLKLVELPWDYTTRACYLTWHESTDRDKGHQWMKALLGQFSLSI